MAKKVKKEKEKNPLHRDFSLGSNLKFIFGTLLREEKMLWLLLPLSILVAPFNQYLWSFASKYIIELITSGAVWQELLPLVFIFFCVMLLTVCINSYSGGHAWYRYIRMRMKLLKGLNRKAMTVDFENLENADVMDMFQRAQNACGGNNNGVEGMMRSGVDFLTQLAVVMVGLFIMGTLSPWMILILLFTGSFSFFSSDWAGAYSKKTVWDVLSNWWRKNSYMNRVSTDFVAAKDIRMFGLSDWLLQKMQGLNDYRYEMQKKNEWIWYLAGMFDNVTWMVSQIAVYAFIIYRVVQKDLSVANAFLYISTAGVFYQYVVTILKSFAGLRQMSREVSDFRSFLVYEGGDAQVHTGKKVPQCPTYEFTFEDVSFRYPGSEKEALRHLNLSLMPGERLAVVGLNGAGKSTFIKLLLRLYEPTSGRILLNGVDIREYNKADYYRLFAPVFQEVVLFALPLSENISMDIPERTDLSRATQCLAMAGLEEKVSELPQGIQTQVLKIIEDTGVDFSGGEKQKLALARALYKDAPVVVLDEPTAALDALAEYALYQNFNQMIGNKSAVYISHRLSSTRFCDHVAMFVSGEMVEYGTHEGLLAQNGAYANMFRVQAQYYETEPACE